MFKTIVYISICLLFQFAMSACHSGQAGNHSTVVHTADSNINPGHDTIKATVAAKDKNEQTMDDGSVMDVHSSIAQNLSKSKNYSVFMGLVEKSVLYKTIGQKGALTIFAPVNSAFDKMDQKTLSRLTSEAGKDDRDKFLKYYMIGGLLRSSDLTNGESLSTIEGDPLQVVITNGKIKLGGGNGTSAEIVKGDILCNNGILHLVDGVLMPKGMK